MVYSMNSYCNPYAKHNYSYAKHNYSYTKHNYSYGYCNPYAKHNYSYCNPYAKHNYSYSYSNPYTKHNYSPGFLPFVVIVLHFIEHSDKTCYRGLQYIYI